jgi:hypothetical protein
MDEDLIDKIIGLDIRDEAGEEGAEMYKEEFSVLILCPSG